MTIICSGKNFSSDSVAPQLLKAFADAKAVGVIIKIHSGGGSPVQSSLIHNEILRLKKKYFKKVEELVYIHANFIHAVKEGRGAPANINVNLSLDMQNNAVKLTM